ncbi:MAG TPA: hypothetical protein VN937_19410 [Blastocatellia bacterium]|nr:hypothetical protein [Blastocatellia bacterium]
MNSQDRYEEEAFAFGLITESQVDHTELHGLEVDIPARSGH